MFNANCKIIDYIFADCSYQVTSESPVKYGNKFIQIRF